MEIRAIQKFVVMSPRKLRVVASLVKGLSPKEAFEKLPYVRKRAAQPLCKVIGTAIANAKQKGINDEDLIFKEVQINEGPRLKRVRAGARGRAKPYKRKMSHIRVVLVTRKSETNSNVKNKKLQNKSKSVEKKKNV